MPAAMPESLHRGLAGMGSRGAVSDPQIRTDWYVQWLLVALAGYAVLGKGFAYLGHPPVLVGEVTIALGLLMLLRSGCAIVALANPASALLAILIAFVTVQTVLGLGAHGLDAVRDSVIVTYGVLAFFVIALLLEKPDRVRLVLHQYGKLAWLYGVVGGLLYYATVEMPMPVWPSSGVSIVYVRLGEAAVHLSGAAIFAIVGLRKVSAWWVVCIVAGILLITPSRGGMLACLAPIAIAVVASGHARRFIAVLSVAAVLLFSCYVIDAKIELKGGRAVSAEQFVENIRSIAGTSDAANLDGTKAWRLRWWKAIQDYTLRGPFFWTGKGYGISLAEDDGFVVGREFGTPIVRVPHNAHLTMLARSGVPGLTLWVLTCSLWFLTIASSWLLARWRGEERWASVFLWVGCYLLSIIIDASFDVALEGPMLGIWFWCLFGFGIGASMIYRWGGRPDLLADLDARDPRRAP